MAAYYPVFRFLRTPWDKPPVINGPYKGLYQTEIGSGSAVSGLFPLFAPPTTATTEKNTLR